MRIFFCDECGRACEVTIDDPMDRAFPSACPFGGTCKWEPAYPEVSRR